MRTIEDLRKLDSSLRPEPRIIACAIVLRRSDEVTCYGSSDAEKLGSDYGAKDAFGVARSTNVRQCWIPHLKRLDAAQEAAKASAAYAGMVLATPTEGQLAPGVTKTIEQVGHGPLVQAARYVQVNWRVQMAGGTVVYDSRHAPPESMTLDDRCVFYNSRTARLADGSLSRFVAVRHLRLLADKADQQIYRPGEPMHMALNTTCSSLEVVQRHV